MFSNKLVVCAALGASVAAAQITGPSSGFVFDAQAKSLRVVMGVPGAAYLGAALDSGLEGASVSPDGKLAITLRDGQIKLIRTGTGESVSLGAWEDGDARFAWNGDSAAVASRRSASLFRKLGSSPERQDLAAPGSEVVGLAVDAAARVLVATREGVAVVDAGGSRTVYAADDVSAMAMSGGDLYLASAARKQVLAVRNYAASPEVAIVAGPSAGLDSPSSLGASPDGTLLYVGDRAAKKLFVFRPATAELAGAIDLDFSPSRMDRFHGSLYLLNDRESASDPVQVFDAAQNAVFFVPTRDLSQATSVEE